jgi:hypothetical protein
MANPPRERAIRPRARDSGTDPMTDPTPESSPEPAATPPPPAEQPQRPAPTKRKAERMRPLNVDVPESLDLHRRGMLCKLDTGLSIKEQVAKAYDEWLDRNGYTRSER